VPWRAFCNALGYDDTGLDRNGGIRPHDHAHSVPREKVAPLYIRGRGIIGESKDLEKVYDIMHRVFPNVLLPKVGNQDEIYGCVVDLLVSMKTQVGSGSTFDVSKWLWEEMYIMVIYRKVPIYALFVMCFLYSVWLFVVLESLSLRQITSPCMRSSNLRIRSMPSPAFLLIIPRMSMPLQMMRISRWRWVSSPLG